MKHEMRDLRIRLTAFAKDCVRHGDMTPGAEQMLLRILDASEEHCMACDHPANEHDDAGVCHALDFEHPEDGTIRHDCACPGLQRAGKK
jgi:hypothetical protein